MKIHLEKVTLRIQKQNVPTINQTKVQTFLNSSDDNHRLIYINKFGDAYPEKTNLHCWWCRYPFETSPLGIPINMTKINDKHFFEMEGIFCSFDCCMAFLSDYSCNSTLFCYKNGKFLLRELYRMTGHDNKLKEAPDWKILEKVGTGNITITQFRSNLAQFYRLPNIVPLSCVSSYMISKNK